MTDHPCGKFGDCSFSRFLVLSRTQTQTDADERLTPATVVGVNKEFQFKQCQSTEGQ